MKNKIVVIFIMIVMLLTVVGCTDNTKQKSIEKNKILVYASFYPMYDFAKNIGGEKINLKLMIPSGIEPHDWEPTAKIMGEIEKADVFIYNGLDLEPWVDKLIGSIDNEKLITVEASKGVHLLGVHSNEYEHDHGKYDPHVWLDPINAIKEAENIKNAFIKADAENKDFYERNYKEFVDKLSKLDKKYKNELSNLEKKEIVVSHAAFGYLADRYGLKQIAISGLSPQEEPSAAKIAKLSDFVKEHNIKYIFFETLTSPKLSRVLAEEVGAKTLVLNPIEGLTEEDIKNNKNYIIIMEENLETLKKALGE
ncbi:metal ABC transporter substrate-binding protein [Tepidibacter thalassicus]|uniref:Zinc transport system substrate-binding protein n=1 Tax=Tepidibacter thalassicus DSM 15285 TaxID=1123350 RepID=A0A1M5NPW9_9FIRM|nr:metal ABC transporter substrate-binding protein [Tepidibacter thalassicus]SHG91538.1 zinc transport system substrate-binding protein [Tepidibacter thalassicus DSM 15285]